MSHGGKRKGAGRPRQLEGMVRFPQRLSAKEALALDRYAKKHGLFHGGRPCRAKAVRHLIQEHCA